MRGILTLGQVYLTQPECFVRDVQKKVFNFKEHHSPFDLVLITAHSFYDCFWFFFYFIDMSALLPFGFFSIVFSMGKLKLSPTPWTSG